jgi:RNA polymerase sigma-70 factor (ECF subfamily)
VTYPAIFTDPPASAATLFRALERACVIDLREENRHCALESVVEAGAGEPDVSMNSRTATESRDDADNFDYLLNSVRKGSDAAARRLVERIYPVVIRIVRSHLPARCDEEDAAQEVFLKMFSRLEQYRGDSPFPHWVSRIATNTCLDLLRRWKARPEVRFADLTVTEEALLQAAARTDEDEALSADAPVCQADSAALVEKLLSGLKPDQQLVVRLLEVEQQSVREVCDRTGWSASKVKMTALRARRKLAGLLQCLGQSSTG